MAATLCFVEELLASKSAVLFMLGSFVVSQSWILLTLGNTGHDVGKLQTVCLLNPTPSSTGTAAREILQKWGVDDIVRFRRHFLVDLWIHPAIYSLFLTSALWHDLRKRQQFHHENPRRMLYGRVATVIIFLGGICDIMENLRHNSIQFEPMLEASDEVLWEACVFASTKWVIMSGVSCWLAWRYCLNSEKSPSTQSSRLNQPPSQARDKSNTPQQSLEFDPDWIGPRPEDHLNTPCAALGTLEVQGRKIPWTVSAPDSYLDSERSYVVSPCAHYIGYGIDEILLQLANKPVKQFLALTIVRTVGLVFRLLSFDDCVYFNNLLLSTNLWPNTIEWSADQVKVINGTLISKTKGVRGGSQRAIIWRSVDPLSQPQLTKLLRESMSCLLVPARIVNWADYSGDNSDMSQLCQKKNFKMDIKLFRKQVGWDAIQQKNAEGWENSKYEMATVPADELTTEKVEQIIDLFNQLYLVKYSRRNPQLTPAGLIRMAKTGFLTVDVLRIRHHPKNSDPHGRIVAFSAVSTTDGVRTASFAGYDVAHNDDKDLYRLMVMLVHCNMIRDGVAKCHYSGGANAFKRHRGATSTVEYNAVFVDHLPFYQQWPWKLAKRMVDKIITVDNAR